jgi:SnoaL-like domain
VMMTKVNEKYWNDYYTTHNERRFDDLVTGFFTEDATFENPKVQVSGREQIVGFLKQSSQFVEINLMPSIIIINHGVTAVELDCVMQAEKDLPDFLLGPIKKGSKASMRMAAVYHLAGDRISRASVYWGRCPE